MSSSKSNNRIAINTVIVYARLFITTLIGLFTTRYILQALGESDYGLYSVLGGILAMLNILSLAMYTTTRRFINVEMGKPNGNLNKIFNISLLLHILFGLLTFVLAEVIGVYYITHYLNVDPGKLEDAYFVFHISTIVAVLGLINVPYQGLLNAYEKFGSIAIIEIIASLLKIPLIICLVRYQGNVLRFYAIGICVISVVTFLYYQIVAYRKFHDIVRFKIYRDKTLYKRILSYNNYNAIGALAYMGRGQGANLIVNYFFGTIVNAAFAIAYIIENYTIQLVDCIGQPFSPQITQNWAGGNMERCLKLVENCCRYSLLVCLVSVFPLIVNMELILKIWIGTPPEGTVLLARLILISVLVRIFCTSGNRTILEASGKIKLLQIYMTIFTLLVLPIAFILYIIGYPAYVILVIFILSECAKSITLAYLIRKELGIDVKHLYRQTYTFLIYMLPLLILGGWGFMSIHHTSYWSQIAVALLSLIYVMLLAWILGINKQEQHMITDKIRARFNIRR